MIKTVEREQNSVGKRESSAKTTLSRLLFDGIFLHKVILEYIKKVSWQKFNVDIDMIVEV